MRSYSGSSLFAATGNLIGPRRQPGGRGAVPRTLLEHLEDVEGVVRSLREPLVRRFGLTGAGYLVLRTLADRPQTSGGGLAQVSGVRYQTMQDTLDGLEKAGLIERPGPVGPGLRSPGVAHAARDGDRRALPGCADRDRAPHAPPLLRPSTWTYSSSSSRSAPSSSAACPAPSLSDEAQPHRPGHDERHVRTRTTPAPLPPARRGAPRPARTPAEQRSRRNLASPEAMADR
jgi:MarR family